MDPARPRRPSPPDQVAPSVYARIFEHDNEGAAILEELVRRFARPPKLEGGIDAVLKTYHDAGARAVLEFIANRINQTHGLPADDDAD